MARIRVGVLRGGPSSEYDVSLKTGSHVLRELSDEKYAPQDIFIDRSGVWHIRGVPVSPAQAVRHVDVVFNALHGKFGEGGQVQRLLDTHGIPYTGSESFPSAVAMNKVLTKRMLEPLGIKMPRHRVLTVSPNLDREMRSVYQSFSPPLVVKPIDGGSSVGVTIARSYPAFVEGVRAGFEHASSLLVEDYIFGREATGGVVESFRGENLYALLPVEIVPAHEEGFFSYGAKYHDKSAELCPGNFTWDEKREIERLSKVVHEALGLRHYSRSDFILSKTGIYFLEVNTLPGLTEKSLIPKALSAIGHKFSDFLDHLLSLALRRR